MEWKTFYTKDAKDWVQTPIWSIYHKSLSIRHLRNLAPWALAQGVAMGSANSLHLSNTMTSIINIWFLFFWCVFGNDFKRKILNGFLY